MLDRIDGPHLPAVRAARAAARARAWAAGARPDLSSELHLDFDATITVAHSDKQNAAATWKRTYGFHPLLCFLDRPDIAGGEALAGWLRPGNAGSNTAADHIAVLDMALPSRLGHDRATRPGRDCWPGRTPPARPTPLPQHAVSVGLGAPSASLSTGGSSALSR